MDTNGAAIARGNTVDVGGGLALPEASAESYHIPKEDAIAKSAVKTPCK